MAKPQSSNPTQPAHRVKVADRTGTVRLDRYLRDRFPRWGRQSVQRLIEGRDVQVNGRDVWLCSWKVKNGDRIAIFAEPEVKTPPVTEFNDRWLLHEDEHLLAVDKPTGLLSHSTRWSDKPGLLELAQARFGGLALFHRLDRDTSGVIICSRTQAANQYLDAAFKDRTVEKEYLAVVPASNRLEAAGDINLPLAQDPRRRDKMRVVEKGGKWALTRYQVLNERGGQQLLLCRPVTGRTHQLRVHLAAMGGPIVGDRLYGGARSHGQRLMLHAYRITLPADSGWPQTTYAATPPGDFAPLLL